MAQGRSQDVNGPRLDKCVADYIAGREHELKPKTLGHIKLYLGRFVAWFHALGIYHVQELTIGLLEQWRREGLQGLDDSTKRLAVAKVRCFLKEALRVEWISNPLADKIRPHRVAAKEIPEPFSADEIQRIMSGCAEMPTTVGYSKHPQTFRLLLELMLATGLRISDALLYNPTAARQGQSGLWIYTFTMTKSHLTKPKVMEVFLPDALKREIDGCAWFSKALPFSLGGTHTTERMSEEIRARMGRIGAKMGIQDCRPHRLRDTYCVRALTRGVPVDEVSRLMGHSSPAVTLQHYAKWTEGRLSRLEGMVATLLHPSGAAQAAVNPGSDSVGDA
jgi:integrase